MNRSPKIALEEQLRKLKDSEEFSAYMGLLQNGLTALCQQLPTLLVTPKDVAEHNQRVGMILGIQKSISMVTVILAELDRDLEQERVKETHHQRG